ncbi:hypothetical protein BST81_08355 [Leptolyngbya sp. 'hensonii']|uniref:hypothetical protein n=1 Tax=Leptolyngbya sp. 'hensonii' TaxID=1922337 RepID=UPI00094FAFDD|nr:hypothetical protein [Leptolyngbya sp. 'hensonii']OLP18916.1 hypothetical protein BST81_08355 [Leptolyngbya sp. 'hensonii']
MSAAGKNQQLLIAFWIGISLLLLANLGELRQAEEGTAVGALMIGAACMFPMYLWCAGKVKGMPVFPFFALTYLWTFSLPLLSENPNVLMYSSAAHFYAAFCTVIFLGSGTLVWWQLVRTPCPISTPYHALQTSKAENFFFGVLVAGVLLNMYILGGWFSLSGGMLALIRGIIFGLSLLGIFVLCYRCGAGQLTRLKSQLLLFLVALYILTSAATLILKTALTVFLLATVAYVVGGRKIPVLPLFLGLLMLLPLHYGKHPMRDKYWNGPGKHYVQPWEYPAWFQEWAGHAADHFTHTPSRYDPPEEKRESFVERSSLIHMLMMAQTKIPEPYPYMEGATYGIIPQLFMPRFMNPNKIRSHEGTHMLNIHIKRQTYQDTLRTTIAWGLLPEAYANFGVMGCAGVGMFLGAFYGLVTRIGFGTPTFSARSLLGVLILSLALASTEWTAGVYVATLFQSSVPLLAMRFIFMKIYRNRKKRKPGIQRYKIVGLSPAHPPEEDTAVENCEASHQLKIT